MKRIGLFLFIFVVVVSVSNLGYAKDFSGVYSGTLYIEKGDDKIEAEIEVVIMQLGKNIIGGAVEAKTGTTSINSGIIGDKGEFILIAMDRFESKDGLPIKLRYRITGRIEKEEMKADLFLEIKGYRMVGKGVNISVAPFRTSYKGKVVGKKRL